MIIYRAINDRSGKSYSKGYYLTLLYQTFTNSSQTGSAVFIFADADLPKTISIYVRTVTHIFLILLMPASIL